MTSNLHPAPLRVLLIEDYTPIRERLAVLIGGIAGVEVVGMAEEPDGACHEIDACRPDLVIVDLQLKAGTSGLTILKWLRTHAPGTAAMVLSNIVHPQMNQVCLELGAKYVLDKTRDTLRLQEAVQELAGNRADT